MLRYGSVSSGIEAASVAWRPLGWSPEFFSEIAKFPSQVLAQRYGSNMPDETLASNGVPNLGDMSEFEGWPDYAIDLLVGGTPCQDYSIAGLRAGMDGVRGSLTLTYAAIARRYRPRWVVWENVPGVLSINRGRDFASFLGLLSGRRIEVPRNGWRNAGVVPGYHRAYGLAWRVLDAQYVRVDGYERAVPQRRRRVFVVGYLGDWRRAAAVLFERESMSGNSAPRRQAGQKAAPTISARPTGGGGLGTDFDLDGGLVSSTGGVAHYLNAGGMGRQDYESETMVAHPLLAKGNSSHDETLETYVAGTICKDSFSGGAGGRPEGAAACHFLPIAFDCKSSGRNGFGVGEISPTLRALGHKDSHANAGGQVAVQQGWAVRRLTPTECERLQGFPDGYTNIPVGKKLAADGPRYKALGNSMAINCMRWIGRRIESVEALTGTMRGART